MNPELKALILETNPWLTNAEHPIIDTTNLIPRIQQNDLVAPTWDSKCTVLIGPRQAGKTTLGFLVSQELIKQKRFENLIYLNCDVLAIREWLKNLLFIGDLEKEFGLTRPLIFIDEVQRLETPGLLLKSVIDLRRPLKIIATGSSQLEIRSKVQEFLTGRTIEAVILPLGALELPTLHEEHYLYGCFPDIIRTDAKQHIIQQLYDDYIKKDIIEFLKIGHPDIMQRLLSLIAHSAGQLVNYQQLAIDLQVSVSTVKNYLTILEKTYTIASITPYVGNKRKEITSNPIYYFIDNGFRNQALRNFSPLASRHDVGLLMQNFVFQELLKFKAQHFLSFDIHYWRTQSGAEIDFIIYVNRALAIPLEVKYQAMKEPSLTKSFHSYLDAYKPPVAFFITKDYYDEIIVKGTTVHFIPIDDLKLFFARLRKHLS